MANITEVEYEKIFSPKTLALLKNKSGESLRQMLGSKDLRTVLSQSQTVLKEIIAAEDGYRDELEMVAAQMVTDAYPIIDYANIKIDAKIVGLNDLDIPNPPEGEDPASPDFGEDNEEKMKAKRRIINGITQGASIRGAFGFMLFKEYIDDINPELVQKYNEILKLAFGIYDDENAIAMMLAALAQGQKMQGGESEMEYDEEAQQFVIKAKAICFPMLVHEIVKGLYEIVGTEGFGADKEKNQAIVNQVDKLSNEPRDLQYGKFIYDAISKIYNDSSINDPRVRELFFAELYKTPDDEFFPFIENAINDELKPLQKKWAADTMKDIAKDLGKDDTGLEDLDEGMFSDAIQKLRKFLIDKRIIKPNAAEAVVLKYSELWDWVESQIDNGHLQSRYVDGIQDIIYYAKTIGINDVDRDEATNLLNMALQDIRGKVSENIEPIEEVMTMKQAIAAAAMLLGTAGAPNMAQAQDKTQPTTTQQDTTNTATATYAHPNENTARSQSAVKAKAALAIKIGKPEGTISALIVDSKMYKLPDGRYECTTTVKLN